MKFSTRSVIGLALLVTLSASAFALVAQDKKGAPAPDAMIEHASPEHALLQKWIGTWDAEVTNYSMGPAPMKSKGVMVSRAMGPLWVVSDFKSEMGGEAFEGHEIAGWNPNTKKYTSVWVDTMLATATTGEGSWDPKTKKLTMAEKMTMGGQEQSMTNIIEVKDDNTMTLTMQMTGPDGKPMTGMTIDYKRRK